MHYLKVTALVAALAALASTSPIPDRSVVEGAASASLDREVHRRDRAIVEGVEHPDGPEGARYKAKRDRAVVEGAEDPDGPEVARYKAKRDRAVVEGAEHPDGPEPTRYKEKRDRAVVEGAEHSDSLEYVNRKEKRGTYSKYENNGPYVPMSDEMEE